MAAAGGDTIVEVVRAALAARTPAAVGAALAAVDPATLAEFFHVGLADDVRDDPIGEGLAASPGAASGEIVLRADDALDAADEGRATILVRPETTPEDVLGMQAAAGVLTTRGGLTSHAAVVARGWGIPAVVGAVCVEIEGDEVQIGDHRFRAGDPITIDGSTGAVYAGWQGTRAVAPPPELDTLLAWADEVCAGHLEVRVNADTAGDAGHGVDLGAVGVGLCRTEHMFLAADRLPAMRRFILAEDATTEAAALAELEVAQEQDFEALLDAMDGRGVTVRLLDPPLHEFLPDVADLTAQEARGELGDVDGRTLAAIRRLRETNPMLGTRGVRLGVVRPGVYEMQVRALCTAAARCFERGGRPHVEIMIPLVVDAEELRIARGWVRDTLEAIGHPELRSNVVTVGAMIETPRAAVTAGALAEHADFFSFGTNDLTQMTFAFSRDDVASRLIPAYERLGILAANPFAVLDVDGVGELIETAVHQARAARPGIKLSVCGEHVGDQASVAFLVGLGIDSVSCSPFRVPMARLGVAQALLACGRVRIGDVALSFGDEVGPSAASEPGPAVEPVTTAAVRHTLRVRGFATVPALVAVHGTDAGLDEALDALVGSGDARFLEPRAMYSLTPEGKAGADEAIAATDPDVVAVIAGAYDDFLGLNTRLKDLCSAWQLRGGAPNDHTDVAYDRGCVDRLVGLAAEADAVLARMAAALDRLDRYRVRLGAAVDAVRAGDTTRFTGVLRESFHDVWMELHEDLILLLGIDRHDEGSF